MSDKPKKFIQSATENAHGQFKAKAKAAGKSTEEYAKEKENAPGRLGKQARLAEVLIKASRHSHKHKHSRSGKEVRKALYGKE